MKLTTLLAAGFAALAVPVLASPMGDDGLHKPDWLRETFRDMREDLGEAEAENRRMLVIWEQRGCIYCTKMHEEVFPDPEIEALIRKNYFVVQMNLFGDVEVTDFDGTVLPEKEMAARWGVMFTPTLMFMPETVPEGGTAAQAAVATMPGAFGKGTTRALLQWVLDRGYEGDEHFQKYVARTMADPSN
ncbi:thioredoxin [Rhodovulum sulfidophilum]|uniref:Thioredoxin family protein n=1 Tax=Rhodovulum visakhapatnamense TaxID=364297 RepID=A0ABS1RKW9_9RHOB|nr:thioredoxin family protein [Rhodovulum visakhapatnamense]MBL3569729.1 thioredoxin family protein [Rhodovulum visakhapatnamense]MBL3580316.1 thioredoxin family protein [Rhodovulum visakhapatnamense]OLS44564.1 thioredoxin [Rhodovulum sulfidophilum]